MSERSNVVADTESARLRNDWSPKTEALLKMSIEFLKKITYLAGLSWKTKNAKNVQKDVTKDMI